MFKETFYSKYIKRLFDIVLSLSALIILSPVLLVTAVLVRIKLGSPVIFTQIRPGKNEKLFKMYKFRTMTSEKDSFGELLPDEVRLTDFGKKLRSTSLDELPELYNILKGDMSIVGPRPLLIEYLTHYDSNQRQRHLVRPGLTGLAQINGRNELDWNEKFNYDVKYVKNISLKKDFSIVIRTVLSVIKKEGINSKTSTTVEPFVGNNHE